MPEKDIVLYIVSTLKHSGTTIQIYNIVKYINREKYDIHLITLSPEEEGSIINKFKSLNVSLESLNMGRFEGFIFGKRKLRQLVEKINPDIIHTQGIRADHYSLIFKDSYPIVSTMQNYPFYDFPMYYGRIPGYFMAKKHLNIIKRRQNFIACAQNVAQLFKDNHNLTLGAIPNGVDLDIFHTVNNEEKVKLRKDLGLPTDKKIFISVGVLIKRKDMTTIIKAFKKAGIDNSFLLIAGEGPEKESLSSLTEGAPEIRLLGNVNNVRDYLQCSDYFISASRAEGLPNAVLEAMACGLPILLTDIKPHRELFEKWKDYGYFFPIGDIQKLSSVMEDMVRQYHKSVAEKTFKLVSENFTARIMSEQYQSLYNKLLGKV